MQVPVDRTSKDPFFRYKMPVLQAVHETSRTALPNLDQVARALYRDPLHILKFLSISLGCTQVKDGSRYFLNGSFDAARLQKFIFDFIDLFVLCKCCRNPETRFVCDEGLLKRSCSSCGAVVAQESHKINNMIMKDIEKCVNDDTKYDVSNGMNIESLLRGEGDASERIYEAYKREDMALGDLFAEYFKPSALRQFSKVFAEHRAEDILEQIEGMLESSRKEDKIESFLKALCKMGVSIDSIDEYFAKPRKGKKRSPLIKKNAEYFISNFED